MAGFWDSHSNDDYSTSEFIDAATMDKLLDSEALALITEVGPPEVGKYGLRRVASFETGGETFKKSFDCSVTGREKLLGDVATYLREKGAGPVPVVFRRWGNAIGLEAAGFDDGSPDLLEPPEDDADPGELG